MPKVSIPLSTFKGADYLRYVSVPSILNQGFQDWELHIVGDDTPDDVESVIKYFNDPRITYENLPEPWYRKIDPNTGMGSKFWNVAGAPALNCALSKCTGEIIARIDQDDAWLPGHLETLLWEFDKHPDLDVVYTTALLFYQNRVGHPMGLKLGVPFDYDRMVHRVQNYIIHASLGWRNAEKLKDIRYSEINEWGPGDLQMWRSMALREANFMWVPKDTVLYMQQCSVDFSKEIIKKYIGDIND